MTENAQPAQLATLQTTLATTPTILAALQAVPTPPLTNLAALISGDSGDNSISGGSGDDPMEGLGGDDRLSGGQGDDLIAGDNIAFGPGVAGTINTTTAIGTTAGNDFVLGGAGNDSLAGDALAFNDNSLTEAAVTSTSTGGSASCDTVTGGTGNDVLSGDVMAISGTQATAYVMNSAEGAGAFAGDDSLRGYNNTDLAAGDALAIAVDTAFASVSNHADAGGSAGDDTMGGDGSADAVAGDALAAGTAGYASALVDNEAISSGTAGNDVIDGQGDKNLMAGDGLAIGIANSEVRVDNTAGGTGAAGNDILTSGDNSDTIAGDALIQSGGFAYVTNEVTEDSLATAGCDTIDSGNNNDLISGDALAQDGGTASVTNNNGGGLELTTDRAGADLILAGAGSDRAAGDALSQGGLAEVVDGGDDTLYGGDGADILSGDALGLGGGTTSMNGGGDDLIYGGTGDDIVYGDANGVEVDGGADVLYGDEGNDILYGNSGDDSLTGGAGDDILYGGDGVDSAFFSGDSSQYQVADLGGGAIQVTDLRAGSPDGTDILYDVENIEFSNGTFTPPAPVVEIGHLLKVATDGTISWELYPGAATVSLVSGVSHGSLTLLDDGNYTYTPDAGYSGLDSFSYLDGGELRTVRIEVGMAGTGSALQVNDVVGMNEQYSDVAMLADGGYVVTWVASASGTKGVYAQRFDAEGNEAGDEIFFPITIGSNAIVPSHVTAAGVGDGGFVLAWQFGSTTASSIQIQRFDAAGDPVGETVTADQLGFTRDGMPEITALQNGGYAVSWQLITGSSTSQVHVRAFDDDGTPRSDAVVLTVGNQYAVHDVTALSDGGFMVAWQKSGSVVGQRFDSFGDEVGEQITFSPFYLAPLFLFNTISTTLLENGDIVVSWSISGLTGSSSDYSVVAQVYDVDGDPQSDIVTVANLTAGNQTAPSVTPLAGGGFLVAWTSSEGDGDGNGIFARQFDADGNAIGGQFRVSDAVVGHQDNVEVTTLADGRLAFSWSAPDGSGDGVFTRILSLGGDLHDNLQGGAEDDYLLGFGGTDVLIGGAGDDTIIGGADADALQGDAGADVFVYTDIVDAGDLIDGFEGDGIDRIDLDGLLDNLGIADADRAARVEVQQAGTGQDATISVDTTGDGVFDTEVVLAINVTGDVDQNDLNLGTLV